MIARWALLGAVVAQLADGLTFVAGLRSGIPLEAEANPVARLLYQGLGLAGVIDFKLATLALIVVIVAVVQHVAPRRAVGRRRVLLATIVVAAGGAIGTFANLSVLLPVLRVA